MMIPYGIAVVENEDTSQFINPKGQVVAQFYNIGSWSEGLIAAVGSRDGHFGYVNNKGDFVIKPQFDMAFPFHEGLAVVIIDNKYGYIDKTGKIILKPQFEVDYSELSHGDFYSFRRFSEGVAQCVYQGYYSFIDKSGKIVFKTNVPYTVFPSAIGPETAVGDFREGLVWVRQNGLYGYLDKSGQMVIEPQYVVAFPFKNGLAVVGKTVGDTVKYGYIDRTGKSIIELQYENVGEFKNGLAAVWVDYERLGYIDRTGKYIRDPDKSTWPVDPIVVILNGKQMDFDTPPLLRNGRTLVPVRAIGEALGADVEWDEGIQTVSLTINGNTVTLIINDGG